MASPMSWFRKYQKGLLAFFGVILMVLFLLPNIGTNSGPAVPREKDPVAVTWKGGSLRNSDLQRMRYLHNHTVQFQQELLRFATRKKNGQPVVPAVPEITPIIPDGAEVSEERANEQIFARYLFAQRAREMGVEISDAMVDDYIALSAGDVTVTESELRAIARQVGGGMGSLGQIRQHLKMELASRQMQIMTQTGMQLIPNPTSAAQFYRRTAEEIECVVLPVAVKDYLDKVQNDPPDAELKRIFTEGQNQLPDPAGKEPGFKIPRRMNVSYVVAEFETFLQNEIAKLTDEEVQAEYDRLVAAGDPGVMEEVTPDLDGGPALDPEAPSGEGTSGTPVAPESGDDGPPSPADDGAVGGEQPVSGGGGPNAGTIPGMTLQDPESPAGDPPLDSPPEQEPAQPEPAEPMPAQPEPSAQEPSQPAPAADEKPPQAEPGDAAAMEVQTPEPAAEPAVEPATAPPQEPERPRRPRPLKDIADQLKRQMKTEAARKEMQSRIEAAEDEVRTWQTDLDLWNSLPESDRDAKPEPITPQQLAARYGFRAGETGLIDELKMSEHELGRLFVFFQQRQFLRLHAILFGLFERQRINEPAVEQSFGTGDRWLYWVTEKKEVEPRTFEQARADVIAFWKLQQARNMARAHAENVADQVNREGIQINQRFGDKAVNTGAFSWYVTGQQGAGFGQPVGVEGAGEEFMRTAFGLEQGKAGVAASESGEQIYVIQKLVGDRRSDEELTDRFIEQVASVQSMPQGVMAVSQEQMTGANRAFMDKLIRDLDIQWPGR